ncbi:MAG: hypothetical protein LCH43_11260 [Actinobacteria bacterium]|nr:hypothetical protein [Actinomycetota bacterium]
MLAGDTSSRICASLNGWPRPIDLPTVLLADIFDLTLAVNSKKGSRPKPHPIRPWKVAKAEKFGNTQGRSREQVLSILQRARDGQLE